MVLTTVQNAIVYLMFLNGILFLGLHFIAFSIVNNGAKGSKRFGYALLIIVFLIAIIQQEYKVMVQLSFADGEKMKAWLASSGVKFNIQMHHGDVKIYGEAAVYTYYESVRITPPKGEETRRETNRLTVVFAKQKGDWKWVHVHVSNYIVLWLG